MTIDVVTIKMIRNPETTIIVGFERADTKLETVVEDIPAFLEDMFDIVKEAIIEAEEDNNELTVTIEPDRIVNNKLTEVIIVEGIELDLFYIKLIQFLIEGYTVDDNVIKDLYEALI